MDNATKKTIEFEKFIAMLRTTKRAGKLVSFDTAIKISGSSPDHLYHAVRRSMETDAAAGRPFIASFLVGNNNQPLPQYFQYAKELGIDIQNPTGWWKGQLAKLGVPNVSNVIRTINAGSQRISPPYGQRNGKHNQNRTNGNHVNTVIDYNDDSYLSDATRSFYTSGQHNTNPTSDITRNRTRGRRGGRGRARSETVINSSVI